MNKEKACVRTVICFAVILQLLSFPALCANAWEQTNGPFSAVVRTIYVHDARIYVGCVCGGVFVSNDLGEHWSRFTSIPVPSGKIPGDVVAIESSGDTIIVALGGADMPNYTGGLFRSVDYGATWTEIDSGLPDIDINALCFHRSALFAGTDKGLWRSPDYGNSWNCIESSVTHVMAVASIDKTIFAGGPCETEYSIPLQKSSNDGVDWEKVLDGKDRLCSRCITVSKSRIYIDGYYSCDSGKSWIGMPDSSSNSYRTPLYDMSSIAVLDSNIFASGSALFRTRIGENSWEELRHTGLPEYLGVARLAAVDSFVFIGTTEGVFRSGDKGATWEEAVDDMKGAFVADLTIYSDTLYASTNCGNFRSTNSGNNWTSINRIRNRGVDDHVVNANCYYGTSDYGIFYSSDGDASWLEYQKPNCKDRFFSDGKRIFRANATGASYTTDRGRDWVASKGDIARRFVYTYAGSNEKLYALTDSCVFRSIDGGTTWLEINLQSNGDDSFWHQLTDRSWYGYHINPAGFAAVDSTMLVGTLGKGLFISQNGGASWTLCADSLVPSEVLSLATYRGSIFAATRKGVLISEDKGFTWRKFNEGMSGIGVISLKIVNDILFAGTAGRGVWKYLLK
jgi:photosystem II stability/assembly factor-like uncharacterized protein